MKKYIPFCFLFVFLAAVISCKSAPKTEAVIEEVIEKVEKPVVEKPGVKTFVNTGVNKATGTISTILVFNSITELTGIHPNTRERFNFGESDYKYDKNSTELKITLPKDVPYKLNELTFHIVGFAADPGIFVLTGIDPKRKTIGVFFEGKKAVLGKDYSYDEKANRITSLVPLNVDEDSFQICWLTKNGVVNFSNATHKHKEQYQKLYAEWASIVGL